MARLDGKVALITGGTSGIGEATVRLFVNEGAKVVFTGRAEEKGVSLDSELGPGATFYRADVMNEAEIKASVDHTVETYGRIDCLFNNAGAATPGEIETLTQDEFNTAMQLLVGSVVFGMKYAVPFMKKQGSRSIISNSSVAALHGGMGPLLYSAAKAAVTQLSKVAGMELGQFGIRVNTISPGGIATPIFYGGSTVSSTMTQAEDDVMLGKLKSGLAEKLPIGRSGVPEDIAHGALYLASDEASFVTTLDLVIDGGLVAGDPDVLPELIGKMFG
jgi:NAD(P)-dependent dehydrogenase (short-subunit alcohol dehydrogenase family)